MIRKFLLKIRKLINCLLDESPGEPSNQQKITVVGNDISIIVIDGKNKT